MATSRRRQATHGWRTSRVPMGRLGKQYLGINSYLLPHILDTDMREAPASQPKHQTFFLYH